MCQKEACDYRDCATNGRKYDLLSRTKSPKEKNTHKQRLRFKRRAVSQCCDKKYRLQQHLKNLMQMELRFIASGETETA